MRIILILIGIVVLVLVVLIALGMLNFDISGGRLPKISVNTGSVAIDESNKTVRVPSVEIKEKQVALPKVDVRPAPSPSPHPAR